MLLQIFMDTSSALASLNLRHGETPFEGHWEQNNWLNTPGAVYCGETDNCFTGPMAAPNNIYVDQDGDEVIFRQPVNLYELNQVIGAAECDPFRGYGADGDLHWSYETIKAWWARRKELESFLSREIKQQLALQDQKNYDHFCAICRWQQYIQNGVYDYLRVYAFFLEEERIPKEGELLPKL